MRGQAVLRQTHLCGDLALRPCARHRCPAAEDRLRQRQALCSACGGLVAMHAFGSCAGEHAADGSSGGRAHASARLHAPHHACSRAQALHASCVTGHAQRAPKPARKTNIMRCTGPGASMNTWLYHSSRLPAHLWVLAAHKADPVQHVPPRLPLLAESRQAPQLGVACGAHRLRPRP